MQYTGNPGYRQNTPISSVNSGTCPKCAARFSLFVLESKRVGTELSSRKRYECSKCLHRFTRYEVPDTFYTQAVKNAKLIQKLREYIDNMSEEVDTTTENCRNCEYNINDKCNFDLPEYGTPDATDCSYFKIGCQKSRGASLVG